MGDIFYDDDDSVFCSAVGEADVAVWYWLASRVTQGVANIDIPHFAPSPLSVPRYTYYFLNSHCVIALFSWPLWGARWWVVEAGWGREASGGGGGGCVAC